MPFRLPSLPAIRVFEAAARHLSFTKAAQELNVTQAAVSHQVRALEEQLGLALFRRTTRRLALTREGQRLQPAATEAFEILRRALTDIGRGEQVLSITTTPSFGARWLAPRLGRFAERHPDIELSVRHTQTVLDLGREGLDLAIRWGKGRWPGVESEMIGPAMRIVVGAPDYIRRLGLKKPADIAKATLLHDETREVTCCRHACAAAALLGRALRHTHRVAARRELVVDHVDPQGLFGVGQRGQVDLRDMLDPG